VVHKDATVRVHDDVRRAGSSVRARQANRTQLDAIDPDACVLVICRDAGSDRFVLLFVAPNGWHPRG